jgi:hypothetical protein
MNAVFGDAGRVWRVHGKTKASLPRDWNEQAEITVGNAKIPPSLGAAMQEADLDVREVALCKNAIILPD